jgi:pimeloyl-ACP methyl ester carboxylesterase
MGAEMTTTTNFQSNLVSAGGERIRYLEAGSGHPLLLVHGLSVWCSAAEWLPYFERLSASFHVYAADLPGWGRTDIPEEHSFQRWIDCLTSLTDVLQLEQMDLMGISLGAWIAALFASEKPERVRRLALLHNPGLNPVVSQFHPIEDFQLPTLEEVSRYFPNAEMAQMAYEDMDQPGRAETHVALLNYIGDPDVRAEWSLRDRLPRMEMPILSADGDSGFVTGTVETFFLAPNARLYITPAGRGALRDLVSPAFDFLTLEQISPVSPKR